MGEGVVKIPYLTCEAIGGSRRRSESSDACQDPVDLGQSAHP